MNNHLQIEYYKNLILRIKRGSHCGVFINAKPLYLLTIIEMISRDMLRDNKIYYDKLLDNVYTNLCSSYGENKTPLFKPYLYLNGDGFYHQKWITNEYKPHDSSAKFVRDNIEYAYLDNALWDLLQDEQIRNDYRTTIENFFLKK